MTVADEASIDGTMTLSTGSITDLSGSISFGDENLSTTGTINVETGSNVGNLTLADGSITDSGGSISFGDENLSTSGTLNAGVTNLASTSTIGNLTLSDGSITDSSGDISFGNENLSTTGTITSGIATMGSGSSIGNITISDGSIASGSDAISFGNDNVTTTGTVTATSFSGDGSNLTGLQATSLGVISGSSPLVLEGESDNDFETTLSLSDPTADRTITFPDVTGTVITTANDNQIDAVGTISSGVWQGTEVTDAYVANDLTIASSGTVSAEQITSTDDLTVADEASIDGTMTLSTGSITDSDGSISFGDENLSTTGTLSSGAQTVTGNITSSGSILPSASDGAAIGSNSNEWADVFVADGATVNFGDDQDVTLTHVADAGLLINDDKQIQFRDNELKINSSADGQLDIDANTEIEMTSALVDLNGELDVSGDITTGASLRTATIDYIDGTLALTVASNGNVTTSGNLAVSGTLSGNGSGLTGVSAGSLASDNLTQGDAAVTLSTSSGAVNITPASGSAIVLDGAVNVDGGVITGATSITTQTQLASTSIQTPLIEYTDGDDAMTISNGGGVTFSQAATLPTGSTIGNLTLANGSITDSGGAIDFDNENLTTVGTVSAEQLTTTDDLTVTDVANIDGTMTISSGSITDSGGAIDFDNENLTTVGTVSAEQLTTTDDLTVTDVANIDGTMTISSGSITDSGGTINFSNENLTTTGTVTANSFSGDGSALTGVPAGSLASDNLTQGDAAVTLSTSSGAVNITPASGSAIVLDGTINVDAGIVTGVTSITTQTQLASTSVQTPLIEYTDGDDAMTIANGGGVTFAQAATLPTGTTAGNLTLANGSITDSGGSISFGDENVSTTGTFASGAQTVTGNMTASGIVSAEQLTTTDDLTVTDVATIDGTVTISSGSITDSGGAISFGNENISTTGTLSSGAATLGTGSTVGNLTLANGSITDSGGAISFGNENISTTGTLSSGAATLGTGSTVGNLTLANGSITDSGGAIDFGNENLSTSGNMTVTSSVQTTTIDYTDGTLALTVASDGTITSSGNVVATGDLTVSGNDIKDNGGSAAITFDGSSNITTGGTLTTTGAISSGGAVNPSSANAAALGSASAEWSDVFVADGAVISLGDDQDVTLTHVHNDGIILNTDNQFQFRDSDLKIYSSADGQLDIDANTEVEITATTLDINGALDASGDVTVGTSLRTGTIDFTDGTLALTVASNGALTTSGNLTVGGTLSGNGSGLTGVPASSLASDNLTQGDAAVTLSTSSGGVNITPASGSAIVLDGTISVDAGIITGATSLTVNEITSNTGIVPDAADGAYLGTSSAEFSDLFMADGAVLNLGDDQDVTLTHVADAGLLLNTSSQLQFRDSDLKVHSSTDGQLDIDANTEVEIARYNNRYEWECRYIGDDCEWFYNYLYGSCIACEFRWSGFRISISRMVGCICSRCRGT